MQVNNKSPFISFGVLKGYELTPYGKHVWGRYKGFKIDVYTDTQDNAKLFYVADKKDNWVKYKFVYSLDNKKRVTGATTNKINVYV